jgi:ABC-type glycerol-3-phosphate transport system substrate-binding protein
MRTFLLSLSLICIVLASCTASPITDSDSTSEAPPTPTATLAPTQESTQSAPEPTELLLWLPPEFDPGSGTSAGRLMQDRLDLYTTQRADVRIEIRVKASSGTGGLLDSLSTANAAAPLAVPDLILLPRSSLEIAALKGLLIPYDGLSDAMNADDWYPFAQGLARLQTSTFGLPFAGDALLLLHRPAEVENPPADWAAAIELAQPLAFPAAEESALFTLAEYLSTGALSQDSEGRPFLDPTALKDVLTFYKEAEAAGVMPLWLTQFTTDEQAWDAYTGNQVNMVITWTNRYLSTLPGDTAAAAILTQDGTPLTLANGWVWALSNPQPERHAMSVDLAEFLIQSEFLAEWSEAAGYLPPRESALDGWSNIALRRIVELIARSAQVIPPNDVLAVVGPALRQATVDILKQQSNPGPAANEAAESVQPLP